MAALNSEHKSNWERWQETQMRALLSFTRFQQAIEQRQFQLAFALALKIQGVDTDMQKKGTVNREVWS